MSYAQLALAGPRGCGRSGGSGSGSCSSSAASPPRSYGRCLAELPSAPNNNNNNNKNNNNHNNHNNNNAPSTPGRPTGRGVFVSPAAAAEPLRGNCQLRRVAPLGNCQVADPSGAAVATGSDVTATSASGGRRAQRTGSAPALKSGREQSGHAMLSPGVFASSDGGQRASRASAFAPLLAVSDAAAPATPAEERERAQQEEFVALSREMRRKWEAVLTATEQQRQAEVKMGQQVAQLREQLGSCHAEASEACQEARRASTQALSTASVTEGFQDQAERWEKQRESVMAALKHGDRAVADELLRKMAELNEKLGANMLALEEQLSQELQQGLGVQQVVLDGLAEERCAREGLAEDVAARLCSLQSEVADRQGEAVGAELVAELREEFQRELVCGLQEVRAARAAESMHPIVSTEAVEAELRGAIAVSIAEATRTLQATARLEAQARFDAFQAEGLRTLRETLAGATAAEARAAEAAVKAGQYVEELRSTAECSGRAGAGDAVTDTVVLCQISENDSDISSERTGVSHRENRDEEERNAKESQDETSLSTAQLVRLLRKEASREVQEVRELCQELLGLVAEQQHACSGCLALQQELEVLATRLPGEVVVEPTATGGGDDDGQGTASAWEEEE
ncbi:unnamed protein product, partial [Polarella glacialis]